MAIKGVIIIPYHRVYIESYEISTIKGNVVDHTIEEVVCTSLLHNKQRARM